jgi:hypothetical protein
MEYPGATPKAGLSALRAAGTQKKISCMKTAPNPRQVEIKDNQPQQQTIGENQVDSLLTASSNSTCQGY